ncbi:hypothetical protein ACSQ67_017791 [Phaseolus vulgaris]
MRVWTLLLLLLLLLLRSDAVHSFSEYLIGVGSHDITGPAADVNMMGYANTEQIASGVHFRLRARAFILSMCILASALVVGSQLFSLLCHFSPLFGDITWLEINYLQFAGELLDAGINRSPSAYLNNPEAERSKYKYNVDKEMTLLKFVDDEWDHKLLELAASFQSPPGKPATKISSVARRVRGAVLRQVDKPAFVSAFCQSNCGDVSPNVLGAFCIDTGLPCDFNHSTCGGKNELCYGRGPGYPDEFESTRIIGERQFRKAVELFNGASEQIKGKVDFRHAFIDFSQVAVNLPKAGSSKVVKTCPAAMGFAFAAGTTDGPGAFDFKQGDDQGNPFWKLVRNVLKTPGKEQIDCHQPKPILLDTGEMKLPYDWAPSILPIQILRVGQLVILSVPGEFTTMAGRRLRDAVKTVLSGNKGYGSNIHVVIAGLTNSYSQYVTTYEEYEMQRYEGASTLYGPHTLSAYIQEFTKLARALISGQPVEPGPQPPDLLDKQISLLAPVVMDATPIGVKFGDCSSDVPKNSTFKRGAMVSVTFWSACPRNDLMTEGTFSLVEFLQGKNTWVSAYDDDDFCLRFKWARPFKFSSHSKATIEWRIPQDVTPGIYRIKHFGAAKGLFRSIRHFTGSSSAFVVE